MSENTVKQLLPNLSLLFLHFVDKILANTARQTSVKNVKGRRKVRMLPSYTKFFVGCINRWILDFVIAFCTKSQIKHILLNLLLLMIINSLLIFTE